MIDGVMEDGEWDNATAVNFLDNSLLLFLTDGDFLYLGIREHSGEMIAVNVFIHFENEISVFHSSAALGTAVYQKEENTWNKTRDFEWCCRQTYESDQATQELENLLTTDHWVASNSRKGIPSEVEYQIKIPGETIRMSVSFLRASDPGQKIPWPTDLNDDCILSTAGGFPQEMAFDINQWGLVHVEYSEK